MATSGTDLITAEGLKRVLDEYASRPVEEVLFAGKEQSSTSGFVDFDFPGSASDYSGFRISIAYRDAGKSIVSTGEVGPQGGTFANAKRGTLTVTVEESTGGFSITCSWSSNYGQYTMARIVGTRPGGGLTF